MRSSSTFDCTGWNSPCCCADQRRAASTISRMSAGDERALAPDPFEKLLVPGLDPVDPDAGGFREIRVEQLVGLVVTGRIEIEHGLLGRACGGHAEGDGERRRCSRDDAQQGSGLHADPFVRPRDGADSGSGDPICQYECECFSFVIYSDARRMVCADPSIDYAAVETNAFPRPSQAQKVAPTPIMSPNSPPAPTDLSAHCHALAGTPLAQLFARDPDRFARLSFVWDDWLVDLSKERLGPDTLPLLVAHATPRAAFPGWIAALFAGEKVNQSERRPALHTALRQRDDAPLFVDGRDIIPDIRAAQARMKTLAAQVRGGLRVGATGRPIRAVVNLGIGGSDLGPLARLFGARVRRRARAAAFGAVDGRRRRLVRRERRSGAPDARARAARSGDDALRRHVEDVHDAGDARQRGQREGLARDRARARASRRRAFRRRHRQRRGGAGVRRRAAATSCRCGTGSADATRCGRRSGCRSRSSSAGNGSPSCSPARASVDAHFRATPLERNLPVLLGLVGWWNARSCGTPSASWCRTRRRCFACPPTCSSSCSRATASASRATAARSPGPTSAGALGRRRHQRPARVLPVAAPGHARGAGRIHRPGARRASAGEPADAAGRECARAGAGAARRTQRRRAPRGARRRKGVAGDELDAAVAARVCPGNRASTTILMPELNAYRLGQLLALYEHRTFVEAVLFGINPFDQFGVELGKTLAGPIVAALAGGARCPRPPTRRRAGSSRTCARSAVRRRPERGEPRPRRAGRRPYASRAARRARQRAALIAFASSQHRRRVEPAPVVARQHVEVVARDPVARALAARGLFLEQQQADRIGRESVRRRRRPSRRRRPTPRARAARRGRRRAGAAPRRAIRVGDRRREQHRLPALPVVPREIVGDAADDVGGAAPQVRRGRRRRNRPRSCDSFPA